MLTEWQLHRQSPATTAERTGETNYVTSSDTMEKRDIFRSRESTFQNGGGNQFVQTTALYFLCLYVWNMNFKSLTHTFLSK